MNSERIRQQFGSYGVRILLQDSQRRITSLYSTNAQGCETSRTLAIVNFNAAVASRIGPTHERIVQGGSIGESLRDDNYQITKRHVGMGQLDGEAYELLMAHFAIAPGHSIALHRYVLEVELRRDRLSYAEIVELHHPEYLQTDELSRIFGTISPSTITTSEIDLLQIPDIARGQRKCG